MLNKNRLKQGHLQRIQYKEYSMIINETGRSDKFKITPYLFEFDSVSEIERSDP